MSTPTLRDLIKASEVKLVNTLTISGKLPSASAASIAAVIKEMIDLKIEQLEYELTERMDKSGEYYPHY